MLFILSWFIEKHFFFRLTRFCIFILYSSVEYSVVSGIQQSDSLMQICVSIFFNSFSIRFLQSVEQSSQPTLGPCWFSVLFIYFLNFIFKLYIIVLVLPNIKMNPPQVYMCSPSWTLLPPHTIPLDRPSAPAPSIQYRASNLDWQLVSYMIFYMFQCHSPKSSLPLPLPQSP